MRTVQCFNLLLTFFQLFVYNFFQGSPLRWATKADEIAMTTSMISTGSPMREHQPQQPQAASIIENQQRSCSANHLDAIVDILGVPSELLTQRDFNKRLFLLKDKKGHPNGVLRRNLRTRHRYYIHTSYNGVERSKITFAKSIFRNKPNFFSF